MSDASESPKGYRYPKLVIGYAVYLYHRLPLSYRDVQELLFKRGIDVSHETVRAWCISDLTWLRRYGGVNPIEGVFGTWTKCGS